MDALSTALIMGEHEIVSQIVDYVPKIDFSVSFNDTSVSLFETTIRYLGGLLSGRLETDHSLLVESLLIQY